jgi:hypothetical protein
VARHSGAAFFPTGIRLGLVSQEILPAWEDALYFGKHRPVILLAAVLLPVFHRRNFPAGEPPPAVISLASSAAPANAAPQPQPATPAPAREVKSLATPTPAPPAASPVAEKLMAMLEKIADGRDRSTNKVLAEWLAADPEGAEPLAVEFTQHTNG